MWCFIDSIFGFVASNINVSSFSYMCIFKVTGGFSYLSMPLRWWNNCPFPTLHYYTYWMYTKARWSNIICDSVVITQPIIFLVKYGLYHCTEMDKRYSVCFYVVLSVCACQLDPFDRVCSKFCLDHTCPYCIPSKKIYMHHHHSTVYNSYLVICACEFCVIWCFTLLHQTPYMCIVFVMIFPGLDSKCTLCDN